MFQPEDLADYELKAVCESWGFDHRVAERSPGRPQLPFGGMPLITLRGLTDMMAVEHCFNPDQALDGINAALRYYRIWTERGPAPRNCLLPGPDAPPEIQQRQARASERSHRMAAERLEATRVRYAIEAQGRRNALELVSDYHYVRRDFY
ncbi:hypothetical protein F5Y04DRAFT_246029 [Hypomontagnella monticulosa]|nr:hypothetical protein F5Y04DRAFT_246029 [Hypomontagnella monticulosa]